MTALAAATADEPQTERKPKLDGVNHARIPEALFVLDTTAIPANPHKPGSGPRAHEMMVDGVLKSYTFQPGSPLELPFAVAVKFLRIPSFKRTNEKGDLLPYQRQPKQPEELGAGERFVLQDHQTVADYEELSTLSLVQRAIELPGGEIHTETRDRKALIAFITKTIVERRNANLEKQPGRRAAPAPVAPVDDADLTDIAPIDE